MYQTVEIERKDLGIGCTVKRNEYLKKKPGSHQLLGRLGLEAKVISQTKCRHGNLAFSHFGFSGGLLSSVKVKVFQSYPRGHVSPWILCDPRD